MSSMKSAECATAPDRIIGHVGLPGLGVSLILAVCLLPQPAPATTRPVRVGLFGDSLAVQAEPYVDLLIQAGGKAAVSNFTYGGTAACDWLPAMRRFARTDHPQAVVLEFAGNTFSPCMLGYAAHLRTSVRLYCSAISQAIQAFLTMGTHVFLVRTPITRNEWVTHDRDWNDLNNAFATLAAQHPNRVADVDAGRSVEGPHHSFVSTMACMYFEPCSGPTIAGVKTDVVRSPDGIHFCPTNTGAGNGRVGRCPVYSSGAFRFAAAMAGPVIRQLHLSGTRATNTTTSAPAK